MDIETLITPIALKRVENHVKNKTTAMVPYKIFDKILPKIKYCRKYSYMTNKYYMFTMIEDVIMDCCIKGKLRYVNISSDMDKLNNLKKDIPLPLKMKILHLIENRYIISKLDMYTYPVYNTGSNYKHTYILYSKNIIYLLFVIYIQSIEKYSHLKVFTYISNNNDNTLEHLYYSIVYNVKSTNKYLNIYIKNTNIVKILKADYSDSEQKYNDYKAELKRYDNMKLINKSKNENRANINKALSKVLYTQAFKEFVRVNYNKLERYKFNGVFYRNICNKAGILKEYNDMIKKVDMCK